MFKMAVRMGVHLRCLASLSRGRACVLLGQRRMLSESAGGAQGSEGNKKAAGSAPRPSEPYDLNVYRVEEYFTHNEFTYYDLEKDMASSRLSQPTPQTPYEHSNPWKSNA